MKKKDIYDYEGREKDSFPNSSKVRKRKTDFEKVKLSVLEQKVPVFFTERSYQFYTSFEKLRLDILSSKPKARVLRCGIFSTTSIGCVSLLVVFELAHKKTWE